MYVYVKLNLKRENVNVLTDIKRYNLKTVWKLKIQKGLFFQIGPDMLCNQFYADCSTFVGVA